MTRVDFYVLPDDGGEGAALTACKLCEKAVTAGKRVHVHAPERALADDVDRLLWTFKQGSFLAHERLGGEIAAPFPQVLIGDAEPPASHHEVMINLGAEVPAFFSRFERVLELVHGDAATRAQCRARYKFYKDRGYELSTSEQAADGSWKTRGTK